MPLPPFNVQGLLPDGVHAASEQELHGRCVAAFSNSGARQRIFENFCRYREVLARAGASVTQWVDGSFVDASRRDPQDIDVVNFCHSDHIRDLSGPAWDQIKRLLGAGSATIAPYSVHSFFVPVYDYDHLPYAAEFENDRKYWRAQFALPLDYQASPKRPAPWRGRKGIVQMTLGDATLCPNPDSSP